MVHPCWRDYKGLRFCLCERIYWTIILSIIQQLFLRRVELNLFTAPHDKDRSRHNSDDECQQPKFHQCRAESVRASKFELRRLCRDDQRAPDRGDHANSQEWLGDALVRMQ